MGSIKLGTMVSSKNSVVLNGKLDTVTRNDFCATVATQNWDEEFLKTLVSLGKLS
jgi:hypothetical protein